MQLEKTYWILYIETGNGISMTQEENFGTKQIDLDDTVISHPYGSNVRIEYDAFEKVRRIAIDSDDAAFIVNVMGLEILRHYANKDDLVIYDIDREQTMFTGENAWLYLNTWQMLTEHSEIGGLISYQMMGPHYNSNIPWRIFIIMHASENNKLTQLARETFEYFASIIGFRDLNGRLDAIDDAAEEAKNK